MTHRRGILATAPLGSNDGGKTWKTGCAPERSVLHLVSKTHSLPHKLHAATGHILSAFFADRPSVRSSRQRPLPESISRRRAGGANSVRRLVEIKTLYGPKNADAHRRLRCFGPGRIRPSNQPTCSLMGNPRTKWLDYARGQYCKPDPVGFSGKIPSGETIPIINLHRLRA